MWPQDDSNGIIVNMPWILFALLSPAVWAVTNVIDKYVLSKLVDDASVPAIAFGVSGFLASLVIFGVRGFPHVSVYVILMSFVAGAVYLAAEYLYFKATKIEEISRVISLIYLDPLFTAVLAAIFLNEIFSPSKYLAIILLVAGAVTISYKRKYGFKFSTAVWLCIISAFLFTTTNLLNKHLLDFSDFWTIFAIVRIGSFLVLVPLIVQKRKVLIDLARTKKRAALMVTFNGFLTLLGTLIFIIALSLGPVALTTAISALQPFFVLVLTLVLGFFYPLSHKEEGGRGVVLQKVIAMAMMFIGVVLIGP